jgi:hypothetical protein
MRVNLYVPEIPRDGMARGRNRARKKMADVPKEEKKFTDLADKRVWASIIVTALILVSAGVWYVNENSVPENVTHIDRSIYFPKDEGRHSEIFETWDLYFNLNSGSEGIGLSMQYAASFLSPDPDKAFYRSARISDEGNITGKTYRYKTMASGNISCPEDALDLRWSGSGSTDRINRVEDSTYQYRYTMSYIDDTGEVLSLNCTLTALKNPILIGSEGKLLLMQYGTLYG